jgi:IS4 transposase
LGYFSLPILATLELKGAFFLSRFKHGVRVYDLSGRPLNLAWELKAHGRFDREVLLGAHRIRARLVALPAPEEVANERRRKARANQDGRLNPSRENLCLMGWNIFLTNVSRTVWPAKALPALYRLRWHIEMIFKAWKSHLGLRQFNARSGSLLRLSVMTKLLFCVLVYRFCQSLELLGEAPRHVSLLRLARIIGQCACLFAAIVLRITPAQWLEHHLTHHLFYDQRRDRKNYFQLLAELNSGLG